MVAPVSIEALRSAAAKDPKAAIRETAKQFEALFMQQLMKSMRDATMSSGMLDNEGSKLGTELLDSQYAVKMSGLPGGLTDAIARQLERQMGIDGTSSSAGKPRAPAPLRATLDGTKEAPLSQRQVDFVRQHGRSAQAAQAQTGIPAAFMIGQAAHETGWGRSEIRNADGSNSHNLFGIKATAGWTGAVAEITTTEVIDGEPRKVSAKFRSYASFDDAFRDYARLLTESPRYSNVAAQAAAAPARAASAAGFAQGLQRAGYATDPAYASKLASIINSTIRAQRAG
jgi:flagellar protein FlgJ